MPDSEEAPGAPLLDDAFARLMAGDVIGAAEACQAAVDSVPDSAPAHELLGNISVGALDDYPRASRHFEAAYRIFRRQGDVRAAARMAIRLANVAETAGNAPGTSGWLNRARRLIDEAGPCVEEGYYCVAIVGCDVPDVAQLETLASRALDLARKYGDADLEVRALAESGLALVSQGRIAEGVARLDEATAALLAGEVADLNQNGLACCSVVTGCDRLGDVERLVRFTEALDRIRNERFHGFQPPILMSHCRMTYGGLLGEAGRWQEAEVELLAALKHSQCVGHRVDALARLAKLRIHQNRLEEAAQLLRGWEDRLEGSAALARLHDARGELDLAASTLRWALRERETDALSSAPLWSHLVDVERRRNDLEAADAAASRLEQIAAGISSPSLQALALLGRARVKLGQGGDAEPLLVEALVRLRGIDRPLLRAEIHLELAGSKRLTAPAEAVTEARAALAIYERLGCRYELERSAGMLRELGVRVRPVPQPSQPSLNQLSRRETEVLALLAEGLSNGEIASRLFLSPKTVEHHVSSVLSKLGLRKRAEVAAWAVQQPQVRPTGA